MKETTKEIGHFVVTPFNIVPSGALDRKFAIAARTGPGPPHLLWQQPPDPWRAQGTAAPSVAFVCQLLRLHELDAGWSSTGGGSVDYGGGITGTWPSRVARNRSRISAISAP